MYWTPNQANGSIEKFIQFCEKYQCATGDINAASGGANFSTDGWNGMLRENVWPTLQRTAERALTNAADTVWKFNDQEQKDQIAAQMEEGFNAEFAKTSGYTDTIICGSGSGGSAENFDCQNVRIVVNWVSAQGGLQEQDQAAQAADSQRKIKDEQAAADIASTDRLYGPQLGQQYRFCRDLGDKCRVIIGANGVPQVLTP